MGTCSRSRGGGTINRGGTLNRTKMVLPLTPHFTAFTTFGAPRATRPTRALPLDMDISLDDARVHVISESLVDARCVFIHRLVERVRRILVPLGKGDER